MQLTQLSCPQCGAPFRLLPGASMATCPFCEAAIAVESGGGGEVSEEVAQVRPFTVDEGTFQRVLLEWLAAGDYTPDDILQKVMVTRHSGVFVPLRRVSGEYRALFSASIGYDREEAYTEVRKKSDGSKERVNKTRTVTDWRPMNGEASETFELVLLASRRVPERLRGWVEARASSCTDGTVALTPPALEGHALEPFELSCDEVMKARGRPQLDAQVEARCESRAPGDRVKDLNVDYTLRDVTDAQLYHPLWLAAFGYGGETYHFALCGRTPGEMSGRRPEDRARREQVKALYKGPKTAAIIWALVGVLGIFLALIPTIIAVLVGIPMTIYMYSQAKKKEKDLLKRSKDLRQEILARVQAGSA